MRALPDSRPVERVILGPCRCQGCGQLVAYLVGEHTRYGWLHEDGRVKCKGRDAEQRAA